MTNYTNDRVAKAKTLFAHAVLRARHQPSSSKDFRIFLPHSVLQSSQCHNKHLEQWFIHKSSTK